MKRVILVLALVSILFTGCDDVSSPENQSVELSGDYVDLNTMDSYPMRMSMKVTVMKKSVSYIKN